MIVSCNACLNRYLIDESLIGPQGRAVRCAACGNSWIQFPQVVEVKSASLEEEHHLHHSHHSRQSYSKPILTVFIVIFLMIGLGFGVYWMRHTLVKTWPVVGNAFEKLGILKEDPATGLLFENIVPLRTQEKTRSLLVLKGEIVNTTKEVRSLSNLTILIQGDCSDVGFFQRLLSKFVYRLAGDRCIIDKWRHTLTQNRLLPGERLGFETAPHPIRDSASEIIVEF
jgi:predicted Zn finger-like uncharacterized protein